MTGGLSSTIVQLITMLGGGGVVGAVVNAILSRRKTGADASKILQEAAGVFVQNIQKQMLAMSERMTQQDIEINALRRSDREKELMIADLQDDMASWKSSQERRNTAHIQWDEAMVRRLGEAGIIVPAPPPLSTY